MQTRSTLKRIPQRGIDDREAILAIIDQAKLCHVGFAVDGQPFVIPTIHGRVGDELFIHGAPASRLLAVVAAGAPLCLTFTLLDGMVIARSAAHHSMNFRSAVVFGHGRKIDDPAEKIAALRRITDHAVPGRWQECRTPSEAELRGVGVCAITIEEVSGKQRSGPPVDLPGDLDLPIWAGVIPLEETAGTLVHDSPDHVPLPASVRDFRWRPPAAGSSSAS